MTHPFNGHLLPERLDAVTIRYAPPPLMHRADKDADPAKRKDKSSDWAILGEALGWPLYVGDRSCMAPLIGAAAVSFFAAPFIFPSTTVGGALINGYLAGSIVYFVEFYGHRPISEIKGNKHV